MKSRAADPSRLDVSAFAADGGELSGEWAGTDLSRLAESQSPPQDVRLPSVRWQARGERRRVPVGEAQVWLHLIVRTSTWLTCQRCLQPYEQPVAVDRWLRFVRDESDAEALDAESEEDVLSMPRWLDLRELAEDELLLALPLVPRHERCPEPLEIPPDGTADAVEPASAHPFAVLKALKPDGGDGSKER